MKLHSYFLTPAVVRDSVVSRCTEYTCNEEFESWFSRVSEHRAGVHEEGEVLAALEERFATRNLSHGPYLFRLGLDAEVEPLEKLIAEGGIRPTGLRWVGVLGAEFDGKGG